MGAMLLENSPLGFGRGIPRHTGAALWSGMGGRSGAGHRYRCCEPTRGASRSSISIAPHPWQNSTGEKQPLCLRVGMRGTKWCEII